MLALVSLFIATFLVAFCAIWLYRVMFGVQNYQSTAIGRKRASNSMKLGAKQGYISLNRKSAKKSSSSKAQPQLRTTNGPNKVPWGW